jgi:hypothetical protein
VMFDVVSKAPVHIAPKVYLRLVTRHKSGSSTWGFQTSAAASATGNEDYGIYFSSRGFPAHRSTPKPRSVTKLKG